MKKIMMGLTLAAAFAMAPPLVLAQFTVPTDGFNNNGTRGAQFLKFPVGARAAAMGESFAAVANDASALFWNPAGTGRFKDLEVHLSHVDYLADINYEFAGLVVPTRAGNLGFSVIMMSMGDEPVTTPSDPTGSSGVTWSAGSFAIGVTYSRALSDRFSVGLTGKYIQDDVYNSSANTLAIDVGSLYDTGLRGLKIGMAMSNFGGKMKLSGRDLNLAGDVDLRTSSWPIPLNFRVGLSWEVLLSESGTLLLAGDFNHPTDANERLNFGAEYGFRKLLFVRGGYKFNYDEEAFTFGAGLQLSKFSFDYAYRDFGILGNVPAFSLNLRL